MLSAFLEMLAISVPSLDYCLPSPLPVFNLIIFVVVVFSCSLCILDINCFSDIGFANIFSSFNQMPFTSLIISFDVQKFLSLM